MVRLLIISLLFVACTPQKRMARICAKYPALCEFDTIAYDTMLYHKQVLDSTFVMRSVDTFIVNRYGVETKVFRHFDTFRIEQNKTDTTYVVQRTRSVVTERYKDNPVWVFAGIALVLGAFWLRR